MVYQSYLFSAYLLTKILTGTKLIMFTSTGRMEKAEITLKLFPVYVFPFYSGGNENYAPLNLSVTN